MGLFDRRARPRCYLMKSIPMERRGFPARLLLSVAGQTFWRQKNTKVPKPFEVAPRYRLARQISPVYVVQRSSPTVESVINLDRDMAATRRTYGRPSRLAFGFFLTACTPLLLSHPPRFSTMSSSKPPKDGRDGALTALGLLIQTLNIAKDACGIPPAQVALGSASTLLTMIRVRLSLLREVKLLTHVV